ncbi:MAG: hypothetical protein LBQ36_05865 [Synergistaceae bacterium]|jgi:uncharacterized protein YxjI|nr:hypothetical protein [Synergistaceae bacterium]
MAKAFFENDVFFIDERVAFLKFTNSYKIFDEDGNQIGNVQQKMSGGYKLLSFFLSKAMFPLNLDIADIDGNVLISLRRGWSFLLSKISIMDERGKHIADISQKFKLLKAEFQILDAAGAQVGKILGDWKAWNFTITDNRDKEIGIITKKWAGILKEAFTSADKYIVSVKPELSDMTKRKAVIASAIVIDMILKESS